VECALLEGGAVDGEKSRTPPPPPPPPLQLAASALHTLALNLSTYILGIGRPVKIAQSMTSKRTFAPVMHAIIDFPVTARSLLRMIVRIINALSSLSLLLRDTCRTIANPRIERTWTQIRQLATRNSPTRFNSREKRLASLLGSNRIRERVTSK